MDSKEKVSEAPLRQLQRIARKPRICSLRGATVVPREAETVHPYGMPNGNPLWSHRGTSRKEISTAYGDPYGADGETPTWARLTERGFEGLMSVTRDLESVKMASRY